MHGDCRRHQPPRLRASARVGDDGEGAERIINSVLLLERGKWTHNRLLRFDFDDILSLKEDATLKATTALLHRESLLPASLQSDNESAWNGHESLLDRLDDNNHKHAFAVSEDLKHALRECIELIGNEAIRHLREVAKERIYDRPDAALAEQLSREALRYMYHLLFLFERSTAAGRTRWWMCAWWR